MNQIDRLKLNICRMEEQVAGDPDCLALLVAVQELRNHIERVEQDNPHLSDDKIMEKLALAGILERLNDAQSISVARLKETIRIEKGLLHKKLLKLSALFGLGLFVGDLVSPWLFHTLPYSAAFSIGTSVLFAVLWYFFLRFVFAQRIKKQMAKGTTDE